MRKRVEKYFGRVAYLPVVEFDTEQPAAVRTEIEHILCGKQSIVF